MNHYVIDEGDDELLIVVGPFATDEDAVTWAAANLEQDTWVYAQGRTP